MQIAELSLIYLRVTNIEHKEDANVQSSAQVVSVHNFRNDPAIICKRAVIPYIFVLYSPEILIIYFRWTDTL
jgi:hypothetical protein